jgi:hypothetical protein
MKAYKLFRVLKSGNITSLFINKKVILPIGEWLPSESHPTKGYSLRENWHCTGQPKAPHLSDNGRMWYEVEIEDYVLFARPKKQGGVWYLAKMMKIIKPFTVESMIGTTIISYGQEAKVESVVNNTIYLDHAIVVPTILYTRDYIYENEIEEYVVQEKTSDSSI